MAARGASILPLYQRYLNGVPKLLARKTLRLRDKYIILVVFGVFTLVCTCAFLFLPSLQERVARLKEGKGVVSVGLKRFLIPEPHNGSLVHVLDKARQPSERGKANGVTQGMGIFPDNAGELKTEIQRDKELFLKKAREVEEERKRKELRELKNVKKDHEGHSAGRGGRPSDPAVRIQRDKVKEMMLHAWNGYKKYGWGANEHHPVSMRPHLGGIFGANSLGATIVDAVDTLYIMEFDDQYGDARDWIAQNLNFDIQADLSVFETNIRFVGGLLSAYALTGDQVFKMKAKDIADRLLPAFNTQTGLPLAIINPKTGSSHNYGWASGGSSILSEVGSLHLEFDYLSTITGDSVYKDKVMKVRTFLKDLEKPDGLYPNYIHPRTGKWGQYHVSMGALGDSFYEYLLKQWLMSNKTDTEARQMYDDAMKAVYERMLVKSNGGLTYFAEFKSGRLEHKMDHLACFSGGMVGLGAEGSNNKDKYLKIAEALADTCHESYARTVTGLGPEAFRFEGPTEAKAVRHTEKMYILRPEVVESWYYMWRLTKQQKYRDWAWVMVQALEKYCRVEGGYAGILDVYQTAPLHDDVQQSFFLAETLKYLYLIFSEDSLLPLDKWVLNTEAHPLPVK
ncbi:hypothetical protein BsWGS_12557 [Bradybaena similaris]